MVKIGDKVKLIDKFYEHEAFKNDERNIRKQIASLKNMELEVKGIYKYSNRVGTGTIDYSIPVELLEKVEAKEPPKEQPKAGDLFRIVDNSHGCHCFEIGDTVTFLEHELGEYEVRGYSNARKRIVNQIVYKEDVEPYKVPKPGDLFRVVGNSGVPHFFENGEIVELVNPFKWAYDCICKGYCKHHGGVFDQVVRISDLAPYTKHRYTDEQIAEAEQIIGKIVASLPDWNNYAFSRTGRRTHMYINNQTAKKHAVCKETDEYNQTIGRMIVLCKHVGRPLPDWL